MFRSDKENSLDMSPIQLKHNLFNTTHDDSSMDLFDVTSNTAFSKFNESKLPKSKNNL